MDNKNDKDVSTVSDSYFDLPSCIEDAFAEIDSDIVMDLLNTDEDYAELSDRMDKLKTQHPVIDDMNEDSGEIRMTAEEHQAYAIGYGLIKRQQNAKYKLTDRGKQLAEQIKVVGDLMVIEIGDLNLLAKKLPERKVEEIVDRWRIKDAENQ